jgi:hypothetical protein
MTCDEPVLLDFALKSCCDKVLFNLYIHCYNFYVKVYFEK